MIDFKTFIEVYSSLEEGRMAMSAMTRGKSVRSGLTRRNRVAKEYAAFKQPQEKSPGLRPRDERSQYGAKHNRSLEFSSYEPLGNVLNESYDSFIIAKPAGYRIFMTAQDLGIKIKGGFSHHPSVEEEIEDKKDKDRAKIN